MHQELRIMPLPVKGSIKREIRSNASEIKVSSDLLINNCSQILKVKSHFYLAYFVRGLAYQKKGEPDRAIDDFSKSIELNTRFAESYLNRGQAYLSIGNSDKAIDDFRKYLEHDPKNASVYNFLGEAYLRKYQIGLAIEYFSKAIANDPGFWKAYRNRGEAYASLGQMALAHYNRGYSYYYQNHFSEATEEFDQAIKFDPTFALIYLGRASCFDALRMVSRARDGYLEFIKIARDRHQDQVNHARQKIAALKRREKI